MKHKELTKLETDILDCISSDYKNLDIALELDIKHNILIKCITGIYAKVGIKGKREMLKYYWLEKNGRL